MKRVSSLLVLVALASSALACSGGPDVQSPNGKRESTSEGSLQTGEPCGSVTCGEGKVCCNASCGICTAPEEGCIMLVCDGETAPPPTTPKPCVKTGCSGQICSDEDINGTCEWLPKYACYRTAACERQADGQCGFRKTKELTDCLAENGSEAE